MTTRHPPEETISRLRKQPRKTASQAIITRVPFEGKVRAELDIPAFIDSYNHEMGQVDVANQLRASYTAHFIRNQKEFFPGMFWLIDMVNTNLWKMFQSLHRSFLVYTSGNRDTRAHRLFFEVLVDLIFLCTDIDWPEKVPIPPEGSPFQYPRFPYTPQQARKRKTIGDLLESLPLRGIQGRPKEHYPASYAPRQTHTHVRTDTNGYCVICRNTSSMIEEVEIQKEKNILGYSRLSFIIQEPREEEQEEIRPIKRFRGTQTRWKCNKCKQPICKGVKEGKSCWDLYHRQIGR
jgi:hypothetical protein